MRALPVHWHEGMFLRPHHFQAADRFWSEQLRQASLFDQPYCWGVRRLDIDRAALKNQQFIINSLQARTPSGTIIRVPEDARLQDLDLRPVFEQKLRTKDDKPIDVHLAVTMLHVGSRNAGSSDASLRFQVETDNDVSDENEPETKRQVKYRRLNLSLLTGQQVAGYETIKLAEVVRSVNDNAPALSESYLPPMLACDALPDVRERILNPLYQKAALKMTELGELVREREINFQTTEGEGRALFEQLRLLNQTATMMRILSRTEGLHPMAAYTEMCRQVGQLAIMAPERMAVGLPDYSHNDVGPCLMKLKVDLDRLLDLFGGERRYQQKAFLGHEFQMRVEVEPRWLDTGWDMYVGVRSTLQGPKVVDLLTGGGLNMKIASPDRVEEVFALGHRGMNFRHEPNPPRVLPLTKGDTFFSIERTPEEWPKVQTSKKVAIRLKEGLLDGKLTDKRVVVLRGAAGQQPQLWFTLYVIPPAV